MLNGLRAIRQGKAVHNISYLLMLVTGVPLQQTEKPFAAADYRGRNCFLLQGDKGEELGASTTLLTSPGVTVPGQWF